MSDTAPPHKNGNGGHNTDVVSDIAEIKRRLSRVEADTSLTINYVREIAQALGIIARIEAIEEELQARSEEPKQ